jgi:AcrR family transcriptional regulator
MSPKPSVSKESILEAAWELIREQGGDKLNARTLAAKLGTSTMPIYSAIGSMAELDGLLRKRIYDALTGWQKRSWSANPMLDMAIGYVMFAKDEPRLFLYLFGEPLDEAARGQADAEHDVKNPLDAPEAEAMLKASPGYAQFIGDLSRDTLNAFVFRTWVFVHGLANLIAQGLLELDKAELVGHLEAAGGAFYAYHAGKDNRK